MAKFTFKSVEGGKPKYKADNAGTFTRNYQVIKGEFDLEISSASTVKVQEGDSEFKISVVKDEVEINDTLHAAGSLEAEELFDLLNVFFNSASSSSIEAGGSVPLSTDIEADSESETKAATPKAVVEYVANAGLPYKVYAAALRSVPHENSGGVQVQVLHNTLGEVSILWDDSEGFYRVTSAGLFTAKKTCVLLTGSTYDEGDHRGRLLSSRYDSNEITISVIDEIGVQTSGRAYPSLADVFIEIRVYP